LADSGDALWIKTESANSIIFSINSVDKCRIDTSGYFKPETDNTLSIGTSSNKWANIYATTFHGDLTGNAATATADTEGRNFIDVYAKEYVQTIDLTGDDITKWYPVTI